MLSRIIRIYKYKGVEGIVRKTILYVIRGIFQYFILVRVKLTPLKFGLNTEKRNKRIIISLTSYPQRFSTLDICLKSLLLQKLKPDAIIVWHDCEDSQITPQLREMEKYGISFKHVDMNLKAHKKYFYAMQEYREDIVITADDDIIYPITMVKSLINTHEKYPNCVCARRVHKIVYDRNGTIKPYNSWIECCHSEKMPSEHLLATGAGGALYLPCMFTDNDMFDADKIKEYCLDADDIWLYCFERKLGINVVWAPCIIEAGYSIKKAQRTNLWGINILQNQNDYYLDKVMSYLGLTK